MANTPEAQRTSIVAWLLAQGEEPVAVAERFIRTADTSISEAIAEWEQGDSQMDTSIIGACMDLRWALEAMVHEIQSLRRRVAELEATQNGGI